MPGPGALRGHDLDTGVEQMRAELHDLLLGDLHLLEAGRDLLKRQIAALASLDRERPQLLDVEDARLGGLLQKRDSLVLVSQPLAPSDGFGLACAGRRNCQVVRFAARAARG